MQAIFFFKFNKRTTSEGPRSILPNMLKKIKVKHHGVKFPLWFTCCNDSLEPVGYKRYSIVWNVTFQQTAKYLKTDIYFVSAWHLNMPLNII